MFFIVHLSVPYHLFLPLASFPHSSFVSRPTQFCSSSTCLIGSSITRSSTAPASNKSLQSSSRFFSRAIISGVFFSAPRPELVAGLTLGSAPWSSSSLAKFS
ncbi:hypothetical protein B0T17DRAFT_530213 [Bombardia bombarda]|uniref:Uncharacterized protein n=1 Tax=Bombardia bombarda TaxID=252184 RepID=A0AA39XCY4_9PEZI|nr:hypothetical protein B0T17DRAFT_530213 [Bombardia bombarda]